MTVVVPLPFIAALAAPIFPGLSPPDAPLRVIVHKLYIVKSM